MADKLFLCIFVQIILLLEIECVLNNSSVQSEVKDIFFNPISDVGWWDDPQGYLHTDGFYYIPGFNPSNKLLSLYKSRKLSNLRDAEVTRVFTAGSESYAYSPEIHFLDGEFYIYFGYPDGFYLDFKQFVIKANNPNNPMGGWSTHYKLPFPGLNSLNEQDGTILNYGNGERYIIWVGQSMVSTGTRLFIAKLCNPMLVCGYRYLLKTINFDWELDEQGRGYLAGPHVLQNAGKTFVIYTANSGSANGSVMGIMGIDDLKDPLVYENWWRNEEPIFRANPDENVFSLGTGAFATSPDGTETWLLYSAKNSTDWAWNLQTMRIQKITWNDDGTPRFGAAIGHETPMETPSGE